MANLQSSKKRAKQTLVRQSRNVARKSSVKTAIKKVLASLEAGDSLEKTQALLRDAESKIARAKGKGIFHANTAARKVSGLAKRVAAAAKK
jgi:small subunit ribosomal protein S20